MPRSSNLPTPRVAYALDAGNPPPSVAITPDGRHVLAGDAWGVVHAWDFAAGARRAEYAAIEGTILQMAALPDGRLATYELNGVPVLHDLDAQRSVRLESPHAMEMVQGLVPHPDGRRLITVCCDSQFDF